MQDLPTTIANHVIGRRCDVLSMASAVAAAERQLAQHESADPIPHAIITLAELERRHILRVLDYTRGDRAAAAMYLGIGRTTLYRKLKEYGLPTGPERSAKI